MKVLIPRAAKGVHFPELFEITMNEFDVERLLPSLFYLVVTKGRPRGPRVNSPMAIDEYLESLFQHPRLEGFEDADGRRLLERWIRASVIHVGTVSRARVGEQIEFVVPRTLLTYKTGLPQQEQRQRGAHQFLYHQLLRATDEIGLTDASDESLRRLFQETFARGVAIGDGPDYDGRYDGHTMLDVETLLTLYFLDGFRPTSAKAHPRHAPGSPALPGVARAMMRDLLAYLNDFGERLPVLAITRGLMSLINLELYVYTVRLAYAVDELTETGRAPACFAGETVCPPEIYVDFLRKREHASHRLARDCFARELEEMRRFFERLVRFRTIRRFCESRPTERDRIIAIGESDKGEYLLALQALSAEDWVVARAEIEFDQVVQDTLQVLTQAGEREDADVYLDAFRRRHASSFDAYIDLLVTEQKRTQVEPLLKWLVSTGGLKKPFGLLAGTTRADAAYVMSDDLLGTLVYVFAAQHEGVTGLRGMTKQLPLADFLSFMERRFGIIVERPPEHLDDARGREAAKQNLQALKRRLREMGFFSDLSDDFGAQYVSLPLSNRGTG